MRVSFIDFLFFYFSCNFLGPNCPNTPKIIYCSYTFHSYAVQSYTFNSHTFTLYSYSFNQYWNSHSSGFPKLLVKSKYRLTLTKSVTKIT